MGNGLGSMDGVFFKGDLEVVAFLRGLFLEEVRVKYFNIGDGTIGTCFVGREERAAEEGLSILSG